jgi:hypothetical protein
MRDAAEAHTAKELAAQQAGHAGQLQEINVELQHTR